MFKRFAALAALMVVCAGCVSTKVAAAFLGVMGADRKGKAVAIFVLPPEDK